jgi:hypothetical protein
MTQLIFYTSEDGQARVGWGEERTPTFTNVDVSLGFASAHPNLRGLEWEENQ